MIVAFVVIMSYLVVSNAWVNSVSLRHRGINLFMGRAAAVRAATKAKTDSAKVQAPYAVIPQ